VRGALARLADRLAMLSDQPPLLPSLRAQQFLGWVRNRFTPVVATRRDRYLFRALANAADLYLDMFANRCYEFDINGEARVLEALSEPPPRCVFDVGANVGDWSAIAARLFANAEIHAFEIVPETARTMEDRLTRAGLTSVHLNAFGLSDAPGTVRVAHLPSFSQGSTAERCGKSVASRRETRIAVNTALTTSTF
jgi:FkbM family methyltransferase